MATLIQFKPFIRVLWLWVAFTLQVFLVPIAQTSAYASDHPAIERGELANGSALCRQQEQERFRRFYENYGIDEEFSEHSDVLLADSSSKFFPFSYILVNNTYNVVSLSLRRVLILGQSPRGPPA